MWKQRRAESARIDNVRIFPYSANMKIANRTSDSILEEATLTSKGQITLPKFVRQTLGVTTGGKVAFELRGGEVVVTRPAATEHEDPAIIAFLGLLEADIRAGKNIRALPEDLAAAMLANIGHVVDLDEPIEGEVDL